MYVGLFINLKLDMKNTYFYLLWIRTDMYNSAE